MAFQHKDLASGRWKQLSFIEQMANIGSEVERAINWKARDNSENSGKAFERALELIDLTLDATPVPSHFKELARLREAVTDYFAGTNQFMSTDASWKRYFLAFGCAVRARR